MNKVSILSLLCIYVIILSGCVPKPIERTEVLTGYDFTKYTALGFLITPEKYNGEYESIGILTLTITPSARYVSLPYELQPGERMSGNVVIETFNVADAIEKLYQEALEMGADAITRFELDPYPFIYAGVEIHGIQVS